MTFDKHLCMYNIAASA
uniref:Uncharacterized protein n=1 Tax=Arundo donax TaxID=35708 RepID=A0A0A8ZC48_ARUDO